MNKTLMIAAIFFATSSVALAEETYIWEEVKTTKTLKIDAKSKEAEALAKKIKAANEGTTKNKSCTTINQLLELDGKYDSEDCFIASKHVTSDTINIGRVCEGQNSTINLRKTSIGWVGDYKITGELEDLSVETTGEVIIKKHKKCKS